MPGQIKFVITLMTAAVLLCSAASIPAQEPLPKPDLVMEKIFLNPSGNIVVEIRNAGPGLLPDKAWTVVPEQASAACFVIMIGVEFVDYATLWAADPNRSLRNPGGSITYTSTIHIQEPTRVRAFVDPTEQIEEARENNNIKEVLLKP